MHVFVTGATGFIGSAVVRELVSGGHTVTGLARSEKAGHAVSAMGARPLIGSIEDVNSLLRGAECANAAIHLAFFHKLSHMKLSNRMGVLLGGSPSGIVSRFGKAALDAEVFAIKTIGNALKGTDRAFVSVMPTMCLTLGKLATENQLPDPSAPGGLRGPSEKAVLEIGSKGVRASVVRLAPVVHDGDKQGLVTLLAGPAKKKGVAAYAGDGSNRWAGVHVRDAARLFRLALENGRAGASYHAVAEQGVPAREIFAALGRRLNIQVASKSPEQIAKLYGWLAPFVLADNPVSSVVTQQQLEWEPTQRGMLADITSK